MTDVLSANGEISLEEQTLESGGEIVDVSQVRNCGFPMSAHAFVEAIKKNRSCQKLIRNRFIQLEARIEENKKLRERVKILKEFQIACRKRIGRALSRKKDARVQLISIPKLRCNSKVDDSKIPAIYHGPAENSQVANYRMAVTNYFNSLNREKWSKNERDDLAKGVKQQFQEMLLRKAVDRFSSGNEDAIDFDKMMASIRDHDITAENMRLFLPKVNWERLASMYVMGRSGAECQARWLNWEDPLVNHEPWTILEDKNLLHVVQQRGISNWIDIAVSLGTNRTPFQCLARYQRSLNASIMKREWTDDEDKKLREAVAAFGESSWQIVASQLEGRMGTQCSNRWTKSLNPIRQRVGKWGADEDKRLKITVMLFGAKNWNTIAEFVPGRTQVQCRERWVNCLDPSLNLGKWTEEEDSMLKAAIEQHGYCWSKVAACIPPRTDSQCRRRWMVLLPHEVPLLQAAKRVQKVALISNFVDRESEKPALGPDDFVALSTIDCTLESQKVKKSRVQNRKSSGDAKTRSRRSRKESNNGDKVENFDGRNRVSHQKTKRKKQPSTNPNPSPSAQVFPEEACLEMSNGQEVRAFVVDGARPKKFVCRTLKKKSRGSGQKEKAAASDYDGTPKQASIEPHWSVREASFSPLVDRPSGIHNRKESDPDIRGERSNPAQDCTSFLNSTLPIENGREVGAVEINTVAASESVENANFSSANETLSDNGNCCGQVSEAKEPEQSASLSSMLHHGRGGSSEMAECSQSMIWPHEFSLPDFSENWNSSSYVVGGSGCCGVPDVPDVRKSSTEDGDETTLAAFLKSLRRKRRLAPGRDV